MGACYDAAMYNRSYGTSGYTPSPRPREEGPKPAPKLPKLPFKIKLNPKVPGLNTAIKILALLLGFLLLVLWLLMGDFRFMLTKGANLTGFPFGNRTYLVLFQNNYELRPTGGFISTYGELKFSHGVYRGIEFFDVYGPIDDHERVEPPLVLSALLEDENYQGHSFRDANFDPDFRLAKEDLTDFYLLTHPKGKVDGILAADFSFMEDLVALYEPIRVEGYELTEQNLFETLSTAVSDIDRHNEEALAERKSVTSPLVKRIISRTITHPWRISKVLKIVAQGFEEKHVLASFNRNKLSKAFAKRNWEGALPQSDGGDFLAINDANYGGMKSNRYITRDVVYELEVTEATDVLGNPIVQATVQITLAHEGIWNIPLSGLYTGYLRTMVPLGSSILSGSEITEERDDVKVLGELVELEPGDSVTYTYTYELPEYVWNNGSYHLHLHKQPGTEADHYRVVVKAPQGLSFTSQEMDVRENVAFYETNLSTDTELSFSLLEDANPPRIISHEITNLNEITIVFNERVSPNQAGDPLSYQIKDLDFTNPTQTDDILIESIRVDGAAVILTTSGMTPQLDERYEVRLRDLRDTAGNPITPNPRTVTVVQNDAFEAVESETDEDSANEETPAEASAETEPALVPEENLNE